MIYSTLIPACTKPILKKLYLLFTYRNANMARGKAIKFRNDKHIASINYNTSKSADLQRHWDASQSGLILGVRRASGDKRQTGKKIWQVRCDVNRNGNIKQSILKIGEFPAMGLDEARAVAAKVRASNGRTRGAGTNTSLNTLFDEILAPTKTGEGVRFPLQKTSHRYQHTLRLNYEKHVNPVIGDVPIREITGDHWRDIIDNLRYEQNKRGAASHILNICNVIYRNLKSHADKGVRSIPNPIKDENIDIGTFDRDRHLTMNELAQLWNGFPNNDIHQTITRVLILTGLRISEVLRMRWSNLENNEWIVGIKGEMKYKKTAHHLPLSPTLLAAIEPMRAMGSPWVFKGNSGGHIQPSTYWQQLQKYAKRTRTEPIYAHLFRHTFMTLKSDAGIEFIDAEFVQHHRITSTGMKYDHSQHIMEKTRALNLWIDHLKNNGVIHD